MEQTLALIERSHKGDKDARNVLAQQNMGLVYTVARRFNGRGCENLTFPMMSDFRRMQFR